MGKVIMVLSLFLVAKVLVAQKVKTFVQAGVSYGVPDSFLADSFGDFTKGNWNDYGSSVCSCAGIIHIDDRNENHERYIAFFPSENNKKSTDHRLGIWGNVAFSRNKSEYVEINGRPFQRQPMGFYDRKTEEKTYSGYVYETELNGFVYMFLVFTKYSDDEYLSSDFQKQVEEVILPTIKAVEKF